MNSVRQRLQLLLLRHARSLVGLLVSAWLVSIALAVGLGWRPRAWWFGSVFVLFLATSLLATWARWQRERTIRERPLPQFLKRKLREHHPHLERRDCDLVERGFRQFFIACLRSDKAFVAMPSKVVDSYWHEFILHTRAYADWCELTLGRFLHHTPAEALGARSVDNDGLRRAWFWSCREGRSSRRSRAGCRCSSPSTPSWSSPAASSKSPTAAASSPAASPAPIRGPAPSIAGRAFPTPRSRATPTAWAAPTRVATAVETAAGVTEVAAAAATERKGADGAYSSSPCSRGSDDPGPAESSPTLA